VNDLHRGLHDTLLTPALAARLERLDASLTATERPLRREEAGDRLALHLSHCLMRAIDSMPEKERVARGVEPAQRIVDQIEQAMGVAPVAVWMCPPWPRSRVPVTVRTYGSSSMRRSRPRVRGVWRRR